MLITVKKTEEKAYKVNFTITKNIVDSIVKLKNKTYYVFISTDQFYNNFKKK